jgi:hypothetical protein
MVPSAWKLAAALLGGQEVAPPVEDKRFLYEHNMKNPKTGKYGLTRTCRSEIDECALCESGDAPAYICAHTAIDTRTYVDNKGRTRSFEKVLLVTKSTAHNTLAKIRKKKGTLKYALIEFSRSKDTEASTGETLLFEGFVKPEKLRKHCPKDVKFEEWIAPFNYEEVFAPRPKEELEKLAGMAPPVGRESSGSSTEGLIDDDEAPFDGGTEGGESVDDLL